MSARCSVGGSAGSPSRYLQTKLFLELQLSSFHWNRKRPLSGGAEGWWYSTTHISRSHGGSSECQFLRRITRTSLGLSHVADPKQHIRSLSYTLYYILRKIPELGFAPIQPIVLGGAAWACGPCCVVPRATVETNPEVSVSRLQPLYEPFYQSLLAFCFNAEQLTSVWSADLPGILKGQPPPAVLDVGHLVAWTLCPTPADGLAWAQ